MKPKLSISHWLFFRFAFTSLLALILAGCETVNTTSHPIGVMPEPQTVTNVDVSDYKGQTHSTSEFINDPCADRLDNILTQLFKYYQVHRDFPEKLEDLKEVLSPSDPPLDLTCPDSHLPYLYYRKPIAAIGIPKQIIVSDPTPVHPGASDGVRNCIFMTPPKPGQPVTMELQPINEGRFRQFIPPSNVP